MIKDTATENLISFGALSFNPVITVDTLIQSLGFVLVVISLILVRRQMRASLFVEYTRRYSEIAERVASLYSKMIHANEISSEFSEEEIATARLYLNFLSEEYVLWKQRDISNYVWDIWQRETSEITRTSGFKVIWRKLRSEYDYFPEFQRHIDHMLRNSEPT